MRNRQVVLVVLTIKLCSSNTGEKRLTSNNIVTFTICFLTQRSLHFYMWLNCFYDFHNLLDHLDKTAVFISVNHKSFRNDRFGKKATENYQNFFLPTAQQAKKSRAEMCNTQELPVCKHLMLPKLECSAAREGHFSAQVSSRTH